MLQPKNIPMGHHRVVVFLACLVLFFTSVASVVSASITGGDEEAATGTPDIRIVGWTIDDSLAGNGDGGLHPGETALLEIFLSNQGNETARNVAATLFEVTDHPDVEILDKFSLWPDLVATGVPGASSAPHFRIQVAQTRPCYWEIPLRLEITAEGGYLETREFTLVMVDPRRTDLADGLARPFYYGANGSDRLGISVAAGDLDGDGYDDLILGADVADGPTNVRTEAGEVVVVYGGPARQADTDLSVSAPGIAFIFGADGGDRLGVSVAAGDLDGDGFDDLILGAEHGDGPGNARSNVGEVVVVYGGPVRFADIDLASPPVGIAFIFGEDASDSLGESVSAGDLDGDGFDDLILGIQLAEGPANARTNGGEVVVVYGGPLRLANLDLVSPPAAGITFIYGASSLDRLGTFVAAGDLDGDGFDDLVLGASSGDGPGNVRFSAGEVVVVYGESAPLANIDLAFPPPDGVSFIFGADANDFLGNSVSTGDLDGDGFHDLILGATGGGGPGDTRAFAGEVVVMYGGPVRLADTDLASPPANVGFVYGVDGADQLGISVAAGDLDGDGFDDLVLGANLGNGPANIRGLAGEVVVVHGSPARLGDTDLASPPANINFVFGADGGDELGASVAVGDLDGDGFHDLILGISKGDGPGNSRGLAGDVVVVPGAPRSRYRHDTDTYAFIDATTGTDLGLGCDDCAATLSIGFDFNYYGRVFDELTVSSNGYLTFNGPGNLPAGFCPPASNPPNETIAVLWDDWNPAAGGSVHSLLEGTAPNRRLTIEWAGVALFPATGAATFEVTLFETSDQILMQYQDTVVGDAFSDKGGTAVVGLENGAGVNGAAASCFTATVGNLSALRFRRFANPTVVFSEDVEAGAAGWTMTALTGPPTPLWHTVSEPTCTPSSRSGNSAFYYGQDSSCDYETGGANSGILTSPIIPALPQDAALSFWQRRTVELEPGTGFDQSFVEAQGNGGGFSTLKQVVMNTGAWSFSEDYIPADPLNGEFSSLDLTGFTGQDLELVFRFDTVDSANNVFLGWMLDDITINACPVYAPGGMAAVASQALATAQPEVVCETAGGRVDAIGSYCSGCGTGLSYQWSQDGMPIGGATGIVYDIPMGGMPGASGYSVGIECSSNPACITESTETTVTVVAQPDAVADTLIVDRSGSDMTVQWTDIAGASDYVLFSSTAPNGAFTNEAAVAASGSPGVTIPLPAENVVFYLVAGRNSVCGSGPKNNFATP